MISSGCIIRSTLLSSSGTPAIFFQNQLCGHLSQFFLGMSYGSNSGSTLGIKRVVVTGYRYVLRNLQPAGFQRLDHLHRDLVIVADNPVRQIPASYHFSNHHGRLAFPVFCMKPYNCIRIVADSSLLQRLYIPLVPIDSLDIIRLENPVIRRCPSSRRYWVTRYPPRTSSIRIWGLSFISV